MNRMTLVVASLSALLSMPASAASYGNNDLDDGDYRCQAGMQGEGHSVVSCDFSGNTVTLEFANGDLVKATLPSDELPEDGSAVTAVDEDGQNWQVTLLVPEAWRVGSE